MTHLRENQLRGMRDPLDICFLHLRDVVVHLRHVIAMSQLLEFLDELHIRGGGELTHRRLLRLLVLRYI